MPTAKFLSLRIWRCFFCKCPQDLKLELRAALEVIDQLKETVAAYEQNHTDELSHKVALLIRIAELERHLGSAVQGQLQTQISNMQAANQQLARSASAQQQADSSQAALDKLDAAEKQISSLYAQLAAASSEKARLQELLEAANQQVAAADELTASLQAQLSEVGEEKVYLQGLLDAANQQIEALQSTDSESPDAALGSTLASQESCTAGTGSGGGTGGTASSDGTAVLPAQPLIRSMTLLQQTQQEAINLHSRLTAAQHAKAALASELECTRTERDLLMHDNASLTQRIAVIESELKTKVAAAQHAAAQAFDAQQQISACLGGMALLGLKSSGSIEECSGSNGGASGSNACSNGGSVSFGGSETGSVLIHGSSDGGSVRIHDGSSGGSDGGNVCIRSSSSGGSTSSAHDSPGPGTPGKAAHDAAPEKPVSSQTPQSPRKGWW